MFDEFSKLLAANDYIAHDCCVNWPPSMLWAFVINDAVIFLSYFSMPVALVYFARRSRNPNAPYPWLPWLLAAFIMVYGISYLAGTSTASWGPLYRLIALLKVITVPLSLAITVTIWPSLLQIIKKSIPDQSDSGLREAGLDTQRVNRLYAALAQCNQAIVRGSSEEALFQLVCRAVVLAGGMKMAWVVITDPATLRLRRTASYGDDKDFLGNLNVSADSANLVERGLAGISIREDKPFWCQDVSGNPLVAPWHELLLRRKLTATAALPLHKNGIVIGALILFSDKPNVFDETTRNLLTEMTADISYALDTFDRNLQHKQAEDKLRAEVEQFRCLVEQSISGSYIIQDGKFTYVNPRFAKMCGYNSEHEVIGLDSIQLTAEKDRTNIAERNKRLLMGDSPSANFCFTALRQDGSSFDCGANSSIANYRGRPAIIGMMQDISEKKHAEIAIQHYISQLKNTLMGTVKVATTLSEMRDPYTAGHERQVGELAVAIGAELGLDTQRLEGLRVAGYLHDIGKINIPSEILSKPGKLSFIENQLIRGHAQAGYEVLKDVEFPWPVARVVQQHHERINGSGYPHRLKDKSILLESRIMAVADVVEAMSSHRPYRPGLGIDMALVEIERGRGTIYDSDVADACLRLFRDKGYAIHSKPIVDIDVLQQTLDF